MPAVRRPPTAVCRDAVRVSVGAKIGGGGVCVVVMAAVVVSTATATVAVAPSRTTGGVVASAIANVAAGVVVVVVVVVFTRSWTRVARAIPGLLLPAGCVATQLLLSQPFLFLCAR